MGLEAPYVSEILGMAREAGMGESSEQSIELVGARAEELRVRWLPAEVPSSAGSTRPSWA